MIDYKIERTHARRVDVDEYVARVDDDDALDVNASYLADEQDWQRVVRVRRASDGYLTLRLAYNVASGSDDEYDVTLSDDAPIWRLVNDDDEPITETRD